MNANDATPANNFTDPNTFVGWLKQLGIAALYASLLYIGERYFDGDIIVGHFEPASGLALAALLIGGKRYAWGVLLGAVLIHAISGDSLWEAAIVASGDTLQALCGAWLLTRVGKFDLRLQSLRDYLRLILLGGCASIAIGALAVNTVLLVFGLLAPRNYFHSLLQWWMSDTLGVILIAPLIMVWWRAKYNWRETGQMAEAALLLGLTILASQIVFLDWLHESIGPVAKGYWMFLITTWVAVRLGTRETVVVLAMTAVYALLGATQGVGFFADDIAQTHLVNYWLYMVTLSVVGMALAAHFTERKQAEERIRYSEALLRQTQSIAAIGSWRLNVPRNELVWSDETYRIFGLPVGTPLSYESFLGHAHPDDRAMADSAWQAALKGAPYRIQHRIVVNGETRWVEERAQFDFDAQGNLYSGTGSVQDITERKQAESALAVSRNLLETVIDAAPVRIFWKDRESRYLGCNPAFARDVGEASPQDVIGKDDYQLGWKEQAERYHADDRQVMDSGIPKLSYDEPQTAPDGKTIWLRTSKVPLRNTGNETIGVLGIYQDVTEQKQAELALRESEAKFRAIIEATPVPLALNDEQGNITYLNQAFVQTVGYTMDDIPTLADWWPRAYPDLQYRQWVAERWQNNLEEARRTHGAFTPMELNIRCKDGSVRTFMGGAASLQEGFAGTYMVMLYDITERKRAEAELRIASAAFESQESMVITDADGVILRVNKAFTETTGYTAEEAVGQTPSLLKSGRHNADFYREMWEVLQRTGTWRGEIWDRRKNGEVYPKWLTISAVKGADGAVTHYVGSHIDITERKAAEDEIKHLAFYDSLTLLPNRRLLMDRLQQALVSSARSGREGALLFIDLDNFKALNDTLGHDIGDLLLQQVAQRLEYCVREGDTVARLGGDEFVVMLEDLSEHPLEAAAQAEAIGDKILATLNQPYQLDTHEHRSTPSIGATLFIDHEQTQDELLKQADIAMYQAKASGRNALCFFDPQMQATVNARAALEGELRKALEGRQFHLHYQIQMDSSHRPLGAEALIRWIHPERGLVSPAQFIPLAEETGLMLPIWQWILDTACAQLKAWQHDALTRDLVLTVIVSAKQFRQADLAAQVQAAVQRHAINPMLLKLELTESVLMENIEGSIATMGALKEVGVQLSLDDFGAGHLSLKYLKRLPLDQIKIDQSFIRDIATDSGDKAIVRTIIALAQNLNLDVIAEGVDTEAQRQRLMNKGCSNYQGYLFGKPVPIEQFEALLKQA